MNLEYAIFRCEPINTLSDLSAIGSHNKREKKEYKSNPDIDINKSKDNIELVPLNGKYVQGFYEITKEYKRQHEEKMLTERSDRIRTYRQMVDKSKNVVADELIFTASPTFFTNMNKEEIKAWANTCMEFVYKDIGYSKEQVLHSIIHLDKKTPHIHCVVIPLIKKYDKRINKEKWTISKKHYIKDKIYLSELQDKYHKRLVLNGYDLERGIKGSDTKHIKIKDYKNLTRKLEQKLEVRNKNLDNLINDFDIKIKNKKNIPFDKNHIILDKETFNTMNKVINESKKIIEIQPKINKVFDDINEYVINYKSIKKENIEYQKEIENLELKNEKLKEKNNKLNNLLDTIIKTIKTLFRKLLIIGNEITKDIISDEVKNYYDYNNFDKDDIINISKSTPKEDELFDYANIPYYYKTDKKKDDFDISI